MYNNRFTLKHIIIIILMKQTNENSRYESGLYPVLEVDHISIGSCLSAPVAAKGNKASKFTNTRGGGANKRTARVTTACGMASTTSTYDALRDIAREDLLAAVGGVDRNLDPLQGIGEEKTRSTGETPTSAVADCLWHKLPIIYCPEVNGLHVGVCEVKGFTDSDDGNIIVKRWGVVEFMGLPFLNVSSLVAKFLKVTLIMSSGNHLIKNRQESFNTVSCSKDLVLVDYCSSTGMRAKAPQRDLPGESMLGCLFTPNDLVIGELEYARWVTLGQGQGRG